MKENVLDVLMYLFEQYYLDEEHNPSADRDSVHSTLLAAGFVDSEIDKALEWLEDLAANQEGHGLRVPADRSIRIYTAEELERIDAESRGFLLFLEQSNILTPLTRELVIDRVMALEADEIDLEQLKWVVLMVLFNQPGEEEAYAWMEDLLFDNPGGYLH